MGKTTSKTELAPDLVDLSLGNNKYYETTISDGMTKAKGGGYTPEESQRIAKDYWKRGVTELTAEGQRIATDKWLKGLTDKLDDDD